MKFNIREAQDKLNRTPYHMKDNSVKYYNMGKDMRQRRADKLLADAMGGMSTSEIDKEIAALELEIGELETQESQIQSGGTEQSEVITESNLDEPVVKSPEEAAEDTEIEEETDDLSDDIEDESDVETDESIETPVEEVKTVSDDLVSKAITREQILKLLKNTDLSDEQRKLLQTKLKKINDYAVNYQATPKATKMQPTTGGSAEFMYESDNINNTRPLDGNLNRFKIPNLMGYLQGGMNIPTSADPLTGLTDKNWRNR